MQAANDNSMIIFLFLIENWKKYEVCWQMAFNSIDVIGSFYNWAFEFRFYFFKCFVFEYSIWFICHLFFVYCQ